MIDPANTGRDRRRRMAVRRTDQTRSGVLSMDIPGVRMLMIVVIKLEEPKIDDTPAR